MRSVTLGAQTFLASSINALLLGIKSQYRPTPPNVLPVVEKYQGSHLGQALYTQTTEPVLRYGMVLSVSTHTTNMAI